MLKIGRLTSGLYWLSGLQMRTKLNVSMWGWKMLRIADAWEFHIFSKLSVVLKGEKYILQLVSYKGTFKNGVLCIYVGMHTCLKVYK